MTQPNLLIIHTDQQSAWTLSCYGGDGTRVETPHLDRLAKEGARFSNFFTNSAVCTPSRGCLLTGRYPHCHGAYRNNLPLSPDEVTIAHCLERAGYDTGYIGKWHLDGETQRPGWVPPERGFGFRDNRLMFNCSHPKSVIDGDGEKPGFSQAVNDGRYMTDWLADKAIEFMGRERTEPFFLMLSIPDPHTPYTVCEPYASMFGPEHVTVPESFADESVPAWVARTRERYAYAFGNSMSDPQREQNLRKHKAAYCGAVKCIDDNVGRMAAFLSEREILDDTVIVFTSDHGDYMGEHGLFGKGGPYETAFRIPMIARWPAGVSAGLVIGDMISTVDFQQTMLSLLGVEPSGREQGRDASGLLRGERLPGFNEIQGHHQTFAHASLFTQQYNLGLAPQGECLLFDRQDDPKEQRNLYGRPDYNDVVIELTGRVVRHHEAIRSPSWSWLATLHGTQQDLVRQGKRLDTGQTPHDLPPRGSEKTL